MHLIMVFLPIYALAVDLSARGLTEVPTNVAPNETELDIRKNEITRVNKNAFFDLRVLIELIISHNRISVIESGAFRGLPVLKRLYLDDNQLSSTPDVSYLSSLEILKFGNNPINWLSPTYIANLTKLTRLYLGDCDFRETFSLPQLNRMIFLDLHANDIKALSKDIFIGYQSIRELTFSHNKLSSLPDMGSAARTIVILWLRYNRLYHIPNLSRFVKLKKIYLIGNYISNLPMDILLPTRANVVLDDNPVTCVKDLCWITSRDWSFSLSLTCPNGKTLAETEPDILCEGKTAFPADI